MVHYSRHAYHEQQQWYTIPDMVTTSNDNGTLIIPDIVTMSNDKGTLFQTWLPWAMTMVHYSRHGYHEQRQWYTIPDMVTTSNDNGTLFQTWLPWTTTLVHYSRHGYHEQRQWYTIPDLVTMNNDNGTLFQTWLPWATTLVHYSRHGYHEQRQWYTIPATSLTLHYIMGSTRIYHHCMSHGDHCLLMQVMHINEQTLSYGLGMWYVSEEML